MVSSAHGAFELEFAAPMLIRQMRQCRPGIYIWPRIWPLSFAAPRLRVSQPGWGIAEVKVMVSGMEFSGIRDNDRLQSMCTTDRQYDS